MTTERGTKKTARSGAGICAAGAGAVKMFFYSCKVHQS
jgi:hypothetical protein